MLLERTVLRTIFLRLRDNMARARVGRTGAKLPIRHVLHWSESAFVSIHTVFMDIRAEIGARDGRLARTRAEEEELMLSFVADLPQATGVSMDWTVIDATTGFAACDFAEEMEADLMVLPGHDRPGGRVPSMADWALQVVPCSVWIVHCGPCWYLQEASS
jgi:nucleotide-binding universal stress UspA family protein